MLHRLYTHCKILFLEVKSFMLQQDLPHEGTFFIMRLIDQGKFVLKISDQKQKNVMVLLEVKRYV
jgi:hypothetical protein